MNDLRRRLKELNAKAFEQLCFDLLKERFPEGGVKHIDGAGGDGGIDAYSGELCGQPSIWQCKSFPDGVRESQKSQIRESLNSALRNFRPANWILCLSVDMDLKAMNWFEKLKKSCRAKVKIGLYSASDILHELMYRRTIRNTYFPNALLDPLELRRIVSKTGELTIKELETLTEDNLEDFNERLKDQDARFSYQIVSDGDMGASAPRQFAAKGLVASISRGSKTINVFARDHEALKSNPPTLRLSLKEGGVEKYKELIRTGKSQEFLPEELGPVSTNWRLLDSTLQSFGSKARLIAGPSPALARQARHVRVTFRKDAQSIEYPRMAVRATRVGTEEVECVCSAQHLPFTFSFVFATRIVGNQRVPDMDASTISFDYKIVGADAKQSKKLLDALALLRDGGWIELFDLDMETVFLNARVELHDDESAEKRAFERLVNDLALVADRFKINLRVPASSELTDESLADLSVLRSMALGMSDDMGDITVEIEKAEGNREVLPAALASGRGVFRFAFPGSEPRFHLFGTPIKTGPLVVEAECHVVDLPRVLEEFHRAPVRDTVKISFRPTGLCSFALLTDSQWQEFGGQALISKKND